MTLNQKREIVERFKAGQAIHMIGVYVDDVRMATLNEVEQVIRDFLNGKFQLNHTKMRKGK